MVMTGACGEGVAAAAAKMVKVVALVTTLTMMLAVPGVSSTTFDENGKAEPGWVPHGVEERERERTFGEDMKAVFANCYVPERLAHVPMSTVETVNSWHFAMMNDLPRNEFYRDMLRAHIVPGETVVLEIGAGSGILSVIAAMLGAKRVVAIEANPDIAQITELVAADNGVEDIVHVIQALSTEVEPEDLPGGEKAGLLVSEIFGVTLNSESALEYLDDARERLLAPDARVLPERGVQYVELIQSEGIDRLTAAREWDGVRLQSFNGFRDTVSLTPTRTFGARMSEVTYETMVEPVAVLDADFQASTHEPDDIYGGNFHWRVRALRSGTVHAALFHWEAMHTLDDGSRLSMSTSPRDTVDNRPRDIHWGQMLQLVGDETNMGQPFEVEEGDELVLEVRYDNTELQARLFRVEGDDEL